jgi:hypothetical protein
MIEFRDDITEDECLDAIASAEDLCDMCVTQTTCDDCPVISLKNLINETMAVATRNDA